MALGACTSSSTSSPSTSHAETLGGPTTAGKVYKVPASIPADCSVDVTQAINDWMASVPNGTAARPSVLAFKPNGCYRVAGSVGAAHDSDPAGYKRSYLLIQGNNATIDGSVDVPPIKTNRA